ncbi:MAG: FHA domain-containing protein [Acidimicrobiia bacterium]|nr:FHA domain-containing protein [Acidimicrobiia bacterium]
MSDEDRQPDIPNDDQDPTLAWDPPSVRDDDGAASASKVAGAFAWALTVENGPQSGLTYVLGPGNTVAGRGGDCAIFLADVTVSREHARFSVDANGLSVTDLGSTNGIYINGTRRDAAKLAEDDELMIGKFHLRVTKGHG